MQQALVSGMKIKLTKCVCARCVYVCGVLRSHTEITKPDGRLNYEGARVQILTKGDLSQYRVHINGDRRQ